MSGAVVERYGRHTIAAILRRSAKDLHRRRQRRPPREALDNVRIAGGRQLSLVPLARYQERVFTNPRGPLFAMWQYETISDERAGACIELAHCHRVLTPVGERDHAPPLGGRRTVGPLPDPVRLLGACERIEIEHRRPLGRCRAVAGERRAPPDPAHMRAVLPEVVQLAADELGVGDPVARLRDRERVAGERREARILLEHCRGLGVLGLHPRHGARAGLVLEPEEPVGRRRAGLNLSTGDARLGECATYGEETESKGAAQHDHESRVG